MANDNEDSQSVEEEIHALRARLAELEKLRAQQNKPQRSARNELSTPIHFIGDFGLIEASGIDLSDGGICFETGEDIPFDMEFEYEGKVHQHRAHMVWMRRLEDGRCRFGFQFHSDSPSGMLWLYRELKDPQQTDE